MCNGFSTRVTDGDAVAIVHSISTVNQQHSGYRIRLQNVQEHPTGYTSISMQPLDSRAAARDSAYTILIHRLGDLTADNSEILYAIQMEQHEEQRLGQLLDLSVGTLGIIGRMLSIRHKGIMVGNGVIGWN